MKKTVTIVLLLSIIALSGCTIDEKIHLLRRR